MNNNTSQQEIDNILWRACETFRGTVNPSGYISYILVLLFVKYLSDVWADKVEENTQTCQGEQERIKRRLSREEFTLPDNATFQYLYEHRNTDNLGEVINIALYAIEEANREKLQGVFRNIDFNSENLGRIRERNERLRHLLDDFHNPKLDIRPSHIGNLDAIGNAYVYLISKFSADAGKKASEFYTPDEVSTLLVKLVNPKPGDRISDPACGSASLLIKAAQEIDGDNYFLYGQEVNGATWALAVMNMFVHNISNFDLQWGDSIRNPLLTENSHLKHFDIVVSNPPFSLWNWGAEIAELDPYNRFRRGIPPKNKGDYAFITHMIETMDPKTGRAGMIVPHGVLFRGSSEGAIRKQLIEENLLDAVIGLPPNLFYGTGIPAVILTFKRNKTDQNVLFIDASEGYEQIKYQNRLRDEDIQRILNAYTQRQSVERYAYLASYDEIAGNDFNLNIPRYVDTNPHFIALTSPEGYELKYLEDVVDLMIRGVSKSQLEGLQSSDLQIPYVTPRHLTDDGRIAYEDADTFPCTDRESRNYGLALPSDILISTSGILGRVAIVPEDLPNGAYFSPAIHGVRVDSRTINPFLVYKALRSDASQLDLKNQSKKTIQPILSLQELLKVRIVIPSKEKLETINIEALQEADTLGKSIRETLEEQVIKALEQKGLDKVREQIIDVLENTLYTLKPEGRILPEEMILKHYPLPIALAYHRMQRAQHNPYEQSARLIELYESLAYFFYNILLSDYLGNKQLQHVYPPSEMKKNVRRAYENFQMEPRISFVKGILDAVRPLDNPSLKIPGLTEVDIIAPLEYIREFRNNEYHSISGSQEAVRARVLELQGELEGLLNQLTFLQNYQMCRIQNIYSKNREVWVRVESFAGTTYETDIGEKLFPEFMYGNYNGILIDQERVVILTPDFEVLDLYPLYQVITSEKYRYESHLCFVKQAKNSKFTGESIKFRSQEALEGYEYLRNRAMQVGLIGKSGN